MASKRSCFKSVIDIFKYVTSPKLKDMVGVSLFELKTTERKKFFGLLVAISLKMATRTVYKNWKRTHDFSLSETRYEWRKLKNKEQWSFHRFAVTLLSFIEERMRLNNQQRRSKQLFDCTLNKTSKDSFFGKTTQNVQKNWPFWKTFDTTLRK